MTKTLISAEARHMYLSSRRTSCQEYDTLSLAMAAWHAALSYDYYDT